MTPTEQNILIAISGFLVALFLKWLLKRTEDAPDKYATKEEVQKHVKHIESLPEKYATKEEVKAEMVRIRAECTDHRGSCQGPRWIADSIEDLKEAFENHKDKTQDAIAGVDRKIERIIGGLEMAQIIPKQKDR